MKTLMRKLIAAKSHTYGTRQLVAGDEYEASRVHSRVLVGARLARYAPEPTPAKPQAKPAPAPEPDREPETVAPTTRTRVQTPSPQARPRETRR